MANVVFIYFDKQIFSLKQVHSTIANTQSINTRDQIADWSHYAQQPTID